MNFIDLRFELDAGPYRVDGQHLVLAYAGAALPLLIVFTIAESRLGDILTGEIVAEKVIRTLVGSIGLVASVPITTALAVLVVGAPRRPPLAPTNSPVVAPEQDFWERD